MTEAISYPKFCIGVPCYEKHALVLGETLKNLLLYDLDIVVIDDGSSAEYKKRIQEECERYGAVYLPASENGGKGHAVKLGIKWAHEQNYDYLIQVDSDGQHDLSVINKLQQIALENPKTLISARPVYDESVPKARRWGRYFTHIWIWIETLGFDLADSMCGLRSYPLKETNEVVDKCHLGNHMDFDPEIMVKLYWRGIPSIFIPTKVLYPEGGASYFRVWEDNVLITKMHTRLFFGMIPRIPLLLIRKFKKNRSHESKWDQTSEKGTVFLMKLTLLFFDVFGKNLVSLLLRLICFYYFIFAKSARKYSRLYSNNYISFCESKGVTPVHFSSFKHILAFSHMVLDKFLVWKNKISLDDFNQDDVRTLKELAHRPKGSLFISSHFGNIELIRSLGRKYPQIHYNALIYTKNSEKMFKILEEIDPNFKEKIIAVQSFGPEVGMVLEDKIKANEWVFCMGDRLSASSEKNLKLNLLGKEAELPLGPFLMSYLLDAEVFSIHCFHDGKEYRIQLDKIDVTEEKTRKNRKQYMESIAKAYIRNLEQLIIKYPSQWFNFYDYWKEGK